MAEYYSYTIWGGQNLSTNLSIGYIDVNNLNNSKTVWNLDNWRNISFTDYGSLGRDKFLGWAGSPINVNGKWGSVGKAELHNFSSNADYYTITNAPITYEGELIHKYDVKYNISGVDINLPNKSTQISDVQYMYLVGEPVTEENNVGTVRLVYRMANGEWVIGDVVSTLIVYALLHNPEKPDEEPTYTNPDAPIRHNPTINFSVDGWNNDFSIMRISDKPVGTKQYYQEIPTIDTLDDFKIFDNMTVTGSSADDVCETLLANVNEKVRLGSCINYKHVEDGHNYFITGCSSVDGSLTPYTQINNTDGYTINKSGETLRIHSDSTENLHVRDIFGHWHFNFSGTDWMYQDEWARDNHRFEPPQELYIAVLNDGYYLVGPYVDATPLGVVIGEFIIYCPLGNGLYNTVLDNIFGRNESENPDSDTEIIDDTDANGDTQEITGDEYNTHDGNKFGTGDIYGGDEKIDDPVEDLPQNIYSALGLFTIFTPTTQQLKDFGSELNSKEVLDVLKDYFTTNPMDGIMGLHMLPFSGISSTTTKYPVIGTRKFTSSPMNIPSLNFLAVDYGTIDVEHIYDDKWLNYSPETDIKIFLPFIGMKELDTNAIMNNQLHLKYIVNVLTGDILAYLYAKTRNRENNVEHLLYQWSGNCSLQMPLVHTDFSNIVSSAIQTATGLGTMAIGGGSMYQSGGAEGGYTLGQGITRTTEGIMGMWKSPVRVSGAISGSSAFMGCRTPYLIFSRPTIVEQGTEYNKEYGKPNYTVKNLSEIKGYTKVGEIKLTGLNCTSSEREEIRNLLMGGVYI